LGRKLQGHAQNFGRGGDVFLADRQHRYLGRTCPWKQCGPGIRASCDALHCGRRPYLHDDLETIKLPPNLIASPPLELWPYELFKERVNERAGRPSSHRQRRARSKSKKRRRR
jgi:hypothetical protein